MTKIVERGTTIPCCKKQVFSTASDNQDTVKIVIFEGERARTQDNHLLGEFLLTGIPPAPRGSPQIEVAFNMDANGILLVTAEEKTTGKKNEIKISNEAGRLSKSDIEKMIADAEKFKDLDEKFKESSSSKVKLEQCVDDLAKVANDPKLKDALPEDDRKEMETVSAETRAWLISNPDATPEEYDSRLEIIKNLTIKAYKTIGADIGEGAGAGGDPSMDASIPSSGGAATKIEEVD